MSLLDVHLETLLLVFFVFSVKQQSLEMPDIFSRFFGRLETLNDECVDDFRDLSIFDKMQPEFAINLQQLLSVFTQFYLLQCVDLKKYS